MKERDGEVNGDVTYDGHTQEDRKNFRKILVQLRSEMVKALRDC